MKIGVIGGGAWGTALAQVAAQDGEPVTAMGARARGGGSRSTTRHVNDLFLPSVPLSPSIRRDRRYRRVARVGRAAGGRAGAACPRVLAELPTLAPRRSSCAPRGSRRGRGCWSAKSRARFSRTRRSPCFQARPSRTKSRRDCPRRSRWPARTPRWARAGRAARRADLPHLCVGRRDRRGDRRRGQERARDRLRRGRGRAAGAECPRRADRARVRRNDAVRAGARRAGGDDGGTVGARRSGADLLVDQQPQFFARRRARRGPVGARLASDRRTVAEGAFTAPVLREAAAEAGIDMPVCEAVCALLDGAPVSDVIGALLARPLREERG